MTVHRWIALGCLLAAGCGNRGNRVPERTEQGTRLNVGATAASPEIHINPGDGGALNVQIGAARANLPGENAPLPTEDSR